MRFGVLGPVEIRTGDGRILTLPRRQERCVLAVLLLEVGQAVPVDRRCELLWPDRLPGVHRGPDISAAVRRLLDHHHLHTAHAAALVLVPNRPPLALAPPTPA